ncbi:MAG: VanZ family protein [Planctomycetes bacterium]|jgi:glycopeptide antibiotics resistance protein|nr:VanZ family protein [Planctomycetota bacterium]
MTDTLQGYRCLWLWPALGYLTFVIHGSLVPWAFRPIPLDEAWQSFQSVPFLELGIGSRADWVANLLLFVPLAFLWTGVFWPRHPGPWRMLVALAIALAGLLLSIAIEFAQLFFPPRTVSQNDILAESLGGILGVLAWWRWGEAISSWLHGWYAARGPGNLAALLLSVYLAILLAYAVLPLDLTISPVEIYHKWQEGKVHLAPFAHTHPGPVELAYALAANTVIWAPVSLLWILSGRRSPLAAWGTAVAVAAGIEGAQLFVYSRVTDVTDVLTAAAGAGIGAWVGRRWGSRASDSSIAPVHARLLASAAGFLLWCALVLAVFWYPFDFTQDWALPRERAERLLRVPFYAYYYGTEFRAVTEVLHKLLFFAPLGVLLACARTMIDPPPPLRRAFDILAFAALTGVAALVELGQLALPGKNPDSTDWFLQTLGGVLGYVGWLFLKARWKPADLSPLPPDPIGSPTTERLARGSPGDRLFAPGTSSQPGLTGETEAPPPPSAAPATSVPVSDTHPPASSCRTGVSRSGTALASGMASGPGTMPELGEFPPAPVRILWPLLLGLVLLAPLAPEAGWNLSGSLGAYLSEIPQRLYALYKSVLLWVPVGVLLVLAGQEAFARVGAPVLSGLFLLVAPWLPAGLGFPELVEAAAVSIGVWSGLWIGAQVRRSAQPDRPATAADRTDETKGSDSMVRGPTEPQRDTALTRKAESRTDRNSAGAGPVPVPNSQRGIAAALLASAGAVEIEEGTRATQEVPVLMAEAHRDAVPTIPPPTAKARTGATPIGAAAVGSGIAAPELAPGRRFSMHVMSRGAALALLAAALFAGGGFPLFGPWLAAGLLAYGAGLYRFPGAWVIAVPALLPVLDLAPWTGRFFLDEFDLLLLVTLAAALWHGSLAPERLRLPRPLMLPLALFALSWVLAAAIGLWPLQALDANAFSSYWSHYNALRVGKGLFWGLTLLVLAQMLLPQGREAAMRHLGLGIGIGLAGVLLVGLRERWQFAGLFDFTETYRITATFSSMHTGGGHIESYLVATIPFLWLWIAPREPLAVRVAGGVLLPPAAYIMVATVSRGGVGGLAVALLVLAGMAWFASRTKGTRGSDLFVPDSFVLGRTPGRNLRWVAVLGTMAVLALGLSGPYFQQRLSTTGQDAGIRAGHWLGAVDLMQGGFATTAFGTGLGRFPAAYLFGALDDTLPGSYRFLVEPSAGSSPPPQAATDGQGFLSADGGRSGRDSTPTTSPASLAPSSVLDGPGQGGASAGGPTTGSDRRDPATSAKQWSVAPLSTAVAGEPTPSGVGSPAQPTSFLRLGSGETLYVTQRVAVSPRSEYRMTLRVRSTDPGARLDVPLCEKHLLDSFRCAWQGVWIPDDGQWHPRELRTVTGEIGGGNLLTRRPTEVFFYNPGPGTVVDVTDLSLVGPDGSERIRNGDFAAGGDHWFFKTHSHLPWHIKNLWVHVYFEQGLLGLFAFLWLTSAALVRLFRAGRDGEPFAQVALAALTGMLVVGLFDSVLDAPRLAILLFIMILVAPTLASPEAPSPRFPGTSRRSRKSHGGSRRSLSRGLAPATPARNTDLPAGSA